MKIYAARSSSEPELSRFIGKDLWIRVTINGLVENIEPNEAHRQFIFNNQQCWIKVIDYIEELAAYRVKIVYWQYTTPDQVRTGEVLSQLLRKTYTVESSSITLHLPIETYLTDELFVQDEV